MKQNLHFILALTCAISLLAHSAYATHNRGAEISYHFINANTLESTIITYTKASSTQADRDSIAITWGEGSAYSILLRTNGPININGNPNGSIIAPDLKMNIYSGRHTYTSVPSAPNNYVIISMTDPNRNGGITNISNSINVPFYVEDTVWFQNAGSNYGPALLYPPVDFANVGDTFTHNPAAYDLEADSLTFDLVVPKQGLGQDVPGYVYPNSPLYGGFSTLTIDHHNGEIVWATPQAQGIYTIAILIREYRDGMMLSSMIRDMQIVVSADTFTSPPLNGYFVDTTIAPGQNFVFTCSTADPDPLHIDTLTAYGGPFNMAPHAASFPIVQGNNVTGTMTWTPGRNQYKRRETRIVSFRSQSNTATHLSTIRAYRITVEDALFTGLNEVQKLNLALSLYPNPSADHISIRLWEKHQNARLMIYDATGKEVYRNESMYLDAEVDIRSFSSGIYLVKIFSPDVDTSAKFVKE